MSDIIDIYTTRFCVGHRLLGPKSSPSWADVVTVLRRALGPSFETSSTGVACEQVTQRVQPQEARAGRSRAGRTSATAAQKVTQPQHSEQQSAPQAAASAEEVATAARLADAAMAELLVRLTLKHLELSIHVHSYSQISMKGCPTNDTSRSVPGVLWTGSQFANERSYHLPKQFAISAAERILSSRLYYGHIVYY